MTRLVLLTVILAFPAEAVSQTSAGGKASEPAKPSAKNPVFTPEREAAAVAFAKSHHPELADILDHLKAMDRTQYENAVANLANQVESLASLQKRDAETHGVALREWKVQSRVNVLAAKVMHLDPSARTAAESEMRRLLEEQSSLRIARKELEIKRTNEQIKRANEQLKKSEEQLAKLKTDRETWIEQQLKRWLRTKERTKSKPKKPMETSTSKPGQKP